MLRLKAELLLDSGAELGEGLQLFPDGDLRWVDIPQGRIFRFDGEHNWLIHEFGHEVSKALPAKEGAVALGRYGLIALDELGQLAGSLALVDEESNLRLSDGTVLPDGSLAVGIVERDLVANAGSLIQVTTGLDVVEVVLRATIPNGCSMLPSNRKMVWVDSPTQTLSLLGWNSDLGILESPKKLVTISTEHGVPDGLCVDTEGGIWVAMWGGGKVIRISHMGELDCVIEVGTPYVTSCAFDRDDNLVISTAASPIPQAQRISFPGAGGLWKLPAISHGSRGQSIRTLKFSKLFA